MFKLTVSVVNEANYKWVADTELTVMTGAVIERRFVVTGRSRSDAFEEAIRFVKLLAP